MRELCGVRGAVAGPVGLDGGALLLTGEDTASRAEGESNEGGPAAATGAATEAEGAGERGGGEGESGADSVFVDALVLVLVLAATAQSEGMCE